MKQGTRQFYERMSIYTDIHRLRESDHRLIQWIANHLGLNFRTVHKYLNMSMEEYEKYAERYGQKPRALEEYKDFIADRLRSFPDTSAAQMHDWLKEAPPFFPNVCPRTVYNTVMEVRAEANVKQNFLTNRPYTDLATLQEQAEAWLSRTGNAMVHATTCRIPFEEWCLECRDLQPYVALPLPKEETGHTALKTNCVRYKGNIYSVPIGTYKGKDTKVRLEEQGGLRKVNRFIFMRSSITHSKSKRNMFSVSE